MYQYLESLFSNKVKWNIVSNYFKYLKLTLWQNNRISLQDKTGNVDKWLILKLLSKFNQNQIICHLFQLTPVKLI